MQTKQPITDRPHQSISNQSEGANDDFSRLKFLAANFLKAKHGNILAPFEKLLTCSWNLICDFFSEFHRNQE